MARTNTVNRNTAKTHEDAPAFGHLKPIQQLRRSVLSCLLWENEFYEDGKTIADRILETSALVKPADLAALAAEARKVFHLRHVPLMLLVALARQGEAGAKVLADAIVRTISRADEPAELIALYKQMNGGKMLSRQMRKGIARALTKFDEYQLAKYDRDGKVKLRDVLRMVRPKPENEEQAALWKRVKDRALATPDTWEVELSAGKDKRETFERLIREDRLGYFALLRNLRNMDQAGVERAFIGEAIVARKNGAHNVLPFRYVAAARAVPHLEPYLDKALAAAIGELPALPGTTGILVDVSGSMDYKLSEKSDLKRIDAAAALAAVFPGDVRVWTFSNTVVEVPPRRGMAGVEAVIKSQSHGGTYLGRAVSQLASEKFDRLIVITDEQSHDAVPALQHRKGYMINVASNKHGVGYGPWTHIDGFSEGVIRYIYETESGE
jgi:hypothetical protein